MRIGKLYVEKSFTKAQLSHAREEIRMIRKLQNSSLTFYTGAFIDDVGGFASMYVVHSARFFDSRFHGGYTKDLRLTES